jgi:hypothetical protein
LQVPVHAVWLVQLSVQLPEAPHTAGENSHAPPELQLQVAPVHAASAASGWELPPPQAAKSKAKARNKVRTLRG